MYEFISILFIVFGVLQIVLFFKVWKMTNDVTEIKEHILNEHTLNEPTSDDIRKAILKNDRNTVKKLLIDSLVNDLIKYKNGESYSDINQIISIHKPRFDKLGIEIPENILQVENHSDLQNLI